MVRLLRALGPGARDHAAGDHLDEDRGDEGKDSQPGEDEEDREQLGAGPARPVVQPRQGRRHHGAIEGVLRIVLEESREPDRADCQDDHRRDEGVQQTPQRVAVIHRAVS